MTRTPAPIPAAETALRAADPPSARTVPFLEPPQDAQTLDNALEALTDTARSLLGADSAVAIVWDERRDVGAVRAASGEGAVSVGTKVGRDVFAGPAGTSVTVPAEGFLRTPLILSVAWREPQAPEALERTEAGLLALARLMQAASAAELELARTHEQARLECVLECVGDGVWIEDDEGSRVNRAARDLLRLADDETTPGIVGELRRLDGTPIAHADRPRVQALASRTAVPFLNRLTRRDGVERVFQGIAAPVYGSAVPDPVGTVVTFRDVTEEYNRTLLTERFLEGLFEALPLAVGVADPVTGEVLSVNRAFGQLVGHESERMIGALPPYPWWDEAPGDASDPGPREALFRRSDGRLVPVELVRLVVREASGAPAAVVTLVTDLSERRRFEQQIVQSGRLAAIGELAAGVAHEINNPLFAILGLVEFLLKEVEPGTKAHERLKLVQQTGLEIKDVVRALLDFARERADEFEVLSLRDVLEQTVDLVRRTSLRKEIELVEVYSSEPLVAFASAGQLKQVVLNLVTNAQQAIGDAGTITIELAREGSNAVVRVADTGPGIDPDVFERIFDPFFTTKRELGGTGLGLPLSQSIVDAHDGTLVAASPAGGGAEFTITLPLGEEAP